MTQDIHYSNQVLLAGFVKHDPDMCYMPAGTPVARFDVCIAEPWVEFQTGNLHPRWESHSVVAFGRLAEVAVEYLKQSQPVEVRGRLRTRRWRDQDNRELTTTEVYADDLTINGVPASTYL